MASFPIADEPISTTDDAGPPGPAWDLPEIGVVVILIGVALVAAGGLAAGIARSFGSPRLFPPGFDRQFVGASIEFGSTWASFVLAAVLLALQGVCWWNLNEWAPETDEVQSPDDMAETHGHLRRGCVIVVAIQIALVLTAAAAIASLVGAILGYEGGGVVLWSSDLSVGAGALAATMVATTGVLLGRRVLSQHSPGQAE